MRGHHMTSQCITWRHTTQEIASHKLKTHQITSHDMTWHLATNHITSPHVTSQPAALLHRSLQPTTSKQVTTSPPWNGWRLVHSNNSVWASQWLVTLCTFNRQILSLTYSFFFETSAPGLPGSTCISCIFIGRCRLFNKKKDGGHIYCLDLTYERSRIFILIETPLMYIKCTCSLSSIWWNWIQYSTTSAIFFDVPFVVPLCKTAT